MESSMKSELTARNEERLSAYMKTRFARMKNTRVARVDEKFAKANTARTRLPKYEWLM